LFSLGPQPELGDTRVLTYGPYRMLSATPLGRAVRVPARLWLPGIVCLSAAAGLGAAALLARVRLRQRELTAMLAALIVVEGWFSDNIAAVPQPPRAAVPPGALVLDLPIGDPVSDAVAEYGAVLGGYRVVNGYSGYEPPHYVDVVRGVRERHDALLDELRRLDELTVIVRSGDRDAQWIAAQPGAERVSPGSPLAVFRLSREGSGRALPLPLPDATSPPFSIRRDP